uniref:Protein kinase domain-containing protein n=1 Tax=Chromera velia CCMP2878 TaxID=1169474 RepID=A0A0G4HWH9_9ALVE|eukprot:Cvel_9051.t1-p1 / transcript=Cvel_9051.t1 / gene=Cvel_9051 / organism=Chromera_velia_CCMP2878 / gene_product=hypothetical protein / transcript_product=hypothetical protein / location=Cvel_scaffold513:23812-27497(-) / protein_length=631 / sequence_SO=supercontig / SO=protein_coding / is_pseudo=false
MAEDKKLKELARNVVGMEGVATKSAVTRFLAEVGDVIGVGRGVFVGMVPGCRVDSSGDVGLSIGKVRFPLYILPLEVTKGVSLESILLSGDAVTRSKLVGNVPLLLGVASKVLSYLLFLSSREVVHGDLNPGQILIVLPKGYEDVQEEISEPPSDAGSEGDEGSEEEGEEAGSGSEREGKQEMTGVVGVGGEGTVVSGDGVEMVADGSSDKTRGCGKVEAGKLEEAAVEGCEEGAEKRRQVGKFEYIPTDKGEWPEDAQELISELPEGDRREFLSVTVPAELEADVDVQVRVLDLGRAQHLSPSRREPWRARGFSLTYAGARPLEGWGALANSADEDLFFLGVNLFWSLFGEKLLDVSPLLSQYELHKTVDFPAWDLIPNSRTSAPLAALVWCRLFSDDNREGEGEGERWGLDFRDLLEWQQDLLRVCARDVQPELLDLPADASASKVEKALFGDGEGFFNAQMCVAAALGERGVSGEAAAAASPSSAWTSVMQALAGMKSVRERLEAFFEKMQSSNETFGCGLFTDDRDFRQNALIGMRGREMIREEVRAFVDSLIVPMLHPVKRWDFASRGSVRSFRSELLRLLHVTKQRQRVVVERASVFRRKEVVVRQNVWGSVFRAVGWHVVAWPP